jgi:hypothetical protein
MIDPFEQAGLLSDASDLDLGVHALVLKDRQCGFLATAHQFGP